MSRLDKASEIIQLASELGVDWRNEPVTNIIRHCTNKIRNWIGDSCEINTIIDLEKIVCQRLRLIFEELWNDDDLDRIINKYVALKEPVFATLRSEFDDHTFATLLERRCVTPDAPDRYIAVIDCRGSKAFRRFFTRWHEVAHLLTLPRQLEFPFHRSTTDRNPLEQLMDTIAGEIGFYEPIFAPAVKSELSHNRRLSFEAVEGIRTRFCPIASLQATLFAAIRHVKTPAIFIEAGLGLKKREQEMLRSNQLSLFPATTPVAKLRVIKTSSNDAARKCGLRIDKNMLVPASSTVTTCFGGEHDYETNTAIAFESLAIWRHSNGEAVGTGLVQIETRFIRDSVIALIQPVTKRIG